MTTAGRRGILALVLVVLLLALGAGAAVVLAGAIEDHPFTGGASPEPIAPADRTMAWLARILLVLALAWVLIGILSARTSLVARPGAAAARATWLASTRPWRARESTLGMLLLDRWLLFAVPVALLIATRAVQSSFVGWMRLAIVIGAWTVFALALRIVVRGRSPWPVMAAVGGVVMLRCTVTLIALAIDGPGGYWYAFWQLAAARGLYVTVAVALFLWLFVAAAWSLFAQLGARRGVGAVLCAVGAAGTVGAIAVVTTGFDRALTLLSDRTDLMPSGLVSALAVALQIEVPTGAAWLAVVAGLVVFVVGALLAVRWDAVRRPVLR
ncbi:hypothetical protein [Microbacterium terrisoli]|jgi:hypothetical protein|uniref:hypothetical protein n=1 Tax=Microbacterium terrisoli TaxID=3242192 RepID=UPI002803B9C5|nr:hypothetical protein [Microbacterium protaetiae]